MKTISSLIAAFWLLSANAQVAQTILVEHFTNSRCGVCANRNPGLYTNINNQTNVLHMAVHPSAPYSSCLLNQHNKAENDARTQFYGIFGSTPRVVVQGNIIPVSADYSAQALFNNYLNKTTPIAISTTIADAGDSLLVNIVVKAVAQHDNTSLLISGFIVEEELNYAAPNGEQVHHDVFRKGLFNMNGETFAAPQNGDSIVFERKVAKNAAWKLDEMYALISIADETKQAVQSARSANLGIVANLKDAVNEKLDVKVFPNPATDNVFINVQGNLPSTVQLFDITGKLLVAQTFTKEMEFPISQFKNGLYIVRVFNEDGYYSQTLNINH
jgi:hypothetical protein